MDEVVIHTDGGCRGNPGPGAHAAVLRWADGEKEVVGTDPHTTNNRMELLAAISALEALEEPCRVTMITDSEYVKRGITEWLPRWIQRDWKTAARKPVVNRDLWERLHALCGTHTMSWNWVRGHAGDAENERCDRLVNAAMDRLEKT